MPDVFQQIVSWVVPIMAGVLGYYAKKIHAVENTVTQKHGDVSRDIAVLRGEVERDREHGKQRHEETLEAMREIRDDVRDVGKSVTVLLSRSTSA